MSETLEAKVARIDERTLILGDKVESMDQKIDRIDCKIDNLIISLTKNTENLSWTKKIIIIVLTTIMGGASGAGLVKVFENSPAPTAASAQTQTVNP